MVDLRSSTRGALPCFDVLRKVHARSSTVVLLVHHFLVRRLLVHHFLVRHSQVHHLPVHHLLVHH